MRFDDQKPIYRQIAEWMQQKIAEGKWPEGERAPAVRDVAMLLQVNSNTALRAYDEMASLGVLQNRRGVGYFIDPNAQRKIKEVMKEKFLGEELPAVFARMETLDVDMDALRQQFEKYKSQKR